LRHCGYRRCQQGMSICKWDAEAQHASVRRRYVTDGNTCHDFSLGRQALVDGPDITRQTLPYRRMALTDLVLHISRGALTGDVKTAYEEENIQKRWEMTSWARKIAAKKRRANLTDFERFKVMVAKKKKSKLVNEQLATMA